MFAPMILDFLGCQVEKNVYSNKKNLLASMKALKNSEINSESCVRIALRLPISVTGRIFSKINVSLDAENIPPRCKYPGRVWEQFLGLRPGFRDTFTLTSGFLNAATSSLKKVPEMMFKRCRQRSKQQLCTVFLTKTALQLFKTINAHIESTG
jgi:hypothetical protein